MARASAGRCVLPHGQRWQRARWLNGLDVGVDITGASGAAERKRGRLADWIEAQEDAINELYGGDEPFLVRGVVLAPFVTRYKAETATKGGVDVIFGADAFALLGGLQEVVYRPSIGGED